MVATYRARIPACTQAINKQMWTVYNTGSSNVVRIYRIWMTSFSTAAVTGGMGTYVLDRFTGAPGGGAAVTPIKHNTASAAVPAGITVLNGNTAITIGSVVSAGILKVFSRSNDEVSAASLTMEELQLIPSLNLIWDGGYGDSNVEPIVLRTGGEGLRCYSLNAGTFGASTVDFIIEMTINAT